MYITMRCCCTSSITTCGGVSQLTLDYCMCDANHLISSCHIWYNSLSSVSNGLGRSRLPTIKNEPTLNYAPGSPERARLIAAVQKMKSEVRDIPCIIGGKEIRTGRINKHVMPSAHNHVLATVHEVASYTIIINQSRCI